MCVQIVNTLPEDAWREFIAWHPHGNIFHTPELFEMYSRAQGCRPELWAAVRDQRILALMLPVHLFLQNGHFRRLTARTVVFGGVLATPGEAGNEALRRLLRVYQQTSGRHTLFTEVRNVSPLQDLLPIVAGEGFVYEDHLNYLIDLDRPEHLLFSSIGKRTQKNIKRGLKKALVNVEEVRNKSDFAGCYRLLELTYQAAHVPLAEYALFEAAFDILLPKKMARFTVARVDGKPAATSFELLYKDVLYGWYGGMDRSSTAYVPNELLMWNILKWGADNGYKKYDFGGAGKPDEEYGVRDFKAKFGGELVCYGRNTWVPNPALMRTSKLAYSLLRPFLY